MNDELDALITTLTESVQAKQNILIKHGSAIGFAESGVGQKDIKGNAVKAEFLMKDSADEADKLSTNAALYKQLIKDLRLEHATLKSELEVNLRKAFQDIAKNEPNLWPELQQRFDTKITTMLYLDSQEHRINKYLVKTQVTEQLKPFVEVFAEEKAERLPLELAKAIAIAQAQSPKPLSADELKAIEQGVNKTLDSEYTGKLLALETARIEDMGRQLAEETKTFWAARVSEGLNLTPAADLNKDGASIWVYAQKEAYLQENMASLDVAAMPSIMQCRQVTIDKYPNFEDFLMGEFEAPTDNNGTDAIGSSCNQALENTLLDATKGEVPLISPYVYNLAKIWTSTQETDLVINSLEQDSFNANKESFLKKIETFLSFNVLSFSNHYVTPLKLTSISPGQAQASITDYFQQLPKEVSFLNKGGKQNIEEKASSVTRNDSSIKVNFCSEINRYHAASSGVTGQYKFLLSSDKPDFTLSLELNADKSIKSSRLDFDVNNLTVLRDSTRAGFETYKNETAHGLFLQMTQAQPNKLASIVDTVLKGEHGGKLEEALSFLKDPKYFSSRTDAVEQNRVLYKEAKNALAACDENTPQSTREALASVMLSSRDAIAQNASRWWRWVPDLTQTVDLISKKIPELSQSQNLSLPDNTLGRLLTRDLELDKHTADFVAKNFSSETPLSDAGLQQLLSSVSTGVESSDFTTRFTVQAKLLAVQDQLYGANLDNVAGNQASVEVFVPEIELTAIKAKAEEVEPSEHSVDLAGADKNELETLETASTSSDDMTDSEDCDSDNEEQVDQTRAPEAGDGAPKRSSRLDAFLEAEDFKDDVVKDSVVIAKDTLDEQDDLANDSVSSHL